MIKVNCYFCGKELNKPGAILLSPPVNNVITKSHICCKCYFKAEQNLTDCKTCGGSGREHKLVGYGPCSTCGNGKLDGTKEG